MGLYANPEAMQNHALHAKELFMIIIIINLSPLLLHCGACVCANSMHTDM
jgi:hypothetical protein